MFEPSKEMGAFLAQCMYAELEKIANIRAVGSTFGTAQIRKSINAVRNLKAPKRLALLESEGTAARRNTLNQADVDLQSIRSLAFNQSKSTNPELRQEALKALEDTEGLADEIKKLKKQRSGVVASGKQIQVDKPQGAAPKPVVKKKPSAILRARNAAGNVTLAGGALGAGVYGYSRLNQPQGMPY